MNVVAGFFYRPLWNLTPVLTVLSGKRSVSTDEGRIWGCSVRENALNSGWSGEFDVRCPEIKLNSRMAMGKSDEVWETHDILSGPDSFLYFCVGLK